MSNPHPLYCQRAGPPHTWSADLLFPGILGHTEPPVSPPACGGGSSTAVFVLLFVSPQVSISVLNLVPPQGRYLFTVRMVHYLSGTWGGSYPCIFHFQAVQSSSRFTVELLWRYLYSDRCKETEHGLCFAFREGRPYSVSPCRTSDVLPPSMEDPCRYAPNRKCRQQPGGASTPQHVSLV